MPPAPIGGGGRSINFSVPGCVITVVDLCTNVSDVYCSRIVTHTRLLPLSHRSMPVISSSSISSWHWRRRAINIIGQRFRQPATPNWCRGGVDGGGRHAADRLESDRHVGRIRQSEPLAPSLPWCWRAIADRCHSGQRADNQITSNVFSSYLNITASAVKLSYRQAYYSAATATATNR